MLWASQVASDEENGLRLRVYGSLGALRWQQEQPNQLWQAQPGQPARLWTSGMAGLPDKAGAATRLPAGHPEGFIEAFAQIYRDFAADLHQHLRGEPATTPRVPGLADGIRSLAFIETVLESHRLNGAWQALG